MLALLTTLLTAQASPIQEAARLIDGPPGCWEVVGEAHWRWDFGNRGLSTGRVVFVGLLDNGLWRDVKVESPGEAYRVGNHPVEIRYPRDLRATPLVGQLSIRLMPAMASGAARSVFQSDFRTIDASNFNRYIASVMFPNTRRVALEGPDSDALSDSVVVIGRPQFDSGDIGGEVAITLHHGDSARAEWTWEEPVSIPGTTNLRMKSIEAWVEGTNVNGEIFPAGDHLAYSVKAGGLPIHVRQDVTYRSFKRCVFEEEAPEGADEPIQLENTTDAPALQVEPI